MNNYKSCPCCNSSWTTLRDFLLENELELVGYQANFENALEGLILFHHTKKGCNTTIALPVKNLTALEQDLKTLSSFIPETKDCLGYCRDSHNLKDCKNFNCKGRLIRKLIALLQMKRDYCNNI